MQPLLNVELTKLSVAERIQLAEDLWDSILAVPESLPVTEAQKKELDQRLEHYKEMPDAGSSWQVVKERLNTL